MNPADEPVSMTLSEEEAHRLLARAGELDARHASDLSLAQLREAAHEAGISSDAFERALHEFVLERDGGVRPRRAGGAADMLTRLWQRVPAPRIGTKRQAMTTIVALYVSSMLTPGDFVGSSLVLAVPAVCLLELSLYVLHRRRSGGGGRPGSSSTEERQETPATPRDRDRDPLARSRTLLRLRPEPAT